MSFLMLLNIDSEEVLRIHKEFSVSFVSTLGVQSSHIYILLLFGFVTHLLGLSLKQSKRGGIQQKKKKKGKRGGKRTMLLV